MKKKCLPMSNTALSLKTTVGPRRKKSMHCLLSKVRNPKGRCKFKNKYRFKSKLSGSVKKCDRFKKKAGAIRPFFASSSIKGIDNV